VKAPSGLFGTKRNTEIRTEKREEKKVSSKLKVIAVVRQAKGGKEGQKAG